MRSQGEGPGDPSKMETALYAEICRPNVYSKAPLSLPGRMSGHSLAANGDRLYRYHGRCLPSSAWVEGTLRNQPGGTGRFEGVTGAGDLRGWTDGTGLEEWHMHFKGTLTKP